MISKETAAIVPFLVLLAEFGVLRQGQAIVRGRLDSVMLSLPVVVAVLITLDILSGTGPLAGNFLPGYENRDFTLSERLLTQPRVIGFHFSQIFWPLPGRFSLEHDFAASTGLLTPATTLVAMLGVASWCAIGVWALFRPSLRMMGFFLLWVPATLVIESTIIPLEMVFEHRMSGPGHRQECSELGASLGQPGQRLQRGRTRLGYDHSAFDEGPGARSEPFGCAAHLRDSINRTAQARRGGANP
jgi:hypothetical protein